MWHVNRSAVLRTNKKKSVGIVLAVSGTVAGRVPCSPSCVYLLCLVALWTHMATVYNSVVPLEGAERFVQEIVRFVP
jgi:hypothetical protein